MRGQIWTTVLKLDGNTTERALRPVIFGRKNYIFMSSEVVGKSAAVAYTLIEAQKHHPDRTKTNHALTFKLERTRFQYSGRTFCSDYKIRATSSSIRSP